ncbi:hypothetical protein IFM89_015460 [Coptis chinensis]|uniref:Uncharacterized protein n=1 Tax=Coptis chinensis TaxID=261450 RepID=A0A835M829_9MAGN|nr:hypothetical protein IFM89_015460 [Coptis chinensis]
MITLVSSPSINISPRFSGPTPQRRRRTYTVQCSGKNQTSRSSANNNEDKNVLIKLAWYSSELLGIAASFFRSPASKVEAQDSEFERSCVVDRAQVMENIKEDFERSYFITGNLTLNAYEEDCEFADPAASFKGLGRFKRNCTNFGSLIEKSKMKLTKWEEFEDKGIGHWSFSCILLFPWRPILSATGYTEYFFDPKSGRVCRHAEHWNVPKMALLKQILRPGPKKDLSAKKTGDF